MNGNTIVKRMSHASGIVPSHQMFHGSNPPILDEQHGVVTHLYREGLNCVNNLVAVDYGMQQEIYETGYDGVTHNVGLQTGVFCLLRLQHICLWDMIYQSRSFTEILTTQTDVLSQVKTL